MIAEKSKTRFNFGSKYFLGVKRDWGSAGTAARGPEALLSKRKTEQTNRS
jgi:hypothetical protein